MKNAARHTLPRSARRWIRSRYANYRKGLASPRIGKIDFGELRTLTPISEVFGGDRGAPLDRYYIEKFLTANEGYIKGHVLEIGDNHSTRQHGGDRVTKSDVLHVEPGNPQATIVADLTKADGIPSNTFDCIILTHTLQMIYDQRSAIRHLHRILKPGGVLLVSTHGLSKIGRRKEKDTWSVYWRMTVDSAEKLFSEYFPPERIDVQGHGNVLAAISFLYGLAAEELKQEELDYNDPDYQVLITIRATKPPPPKESARDRSVFKGMSGASSTVHEGSDERL